VPVTPLSGITPIRSHAELPCWLWPGDAFQVTVPLMAFDDRLRPLPAGRYRVEVDEVQEGYVDVPASTQDGALDVVVKVRR
jgi:hypothetical protein